MRARWRTDKNQSLEREYGELSDVGEWNGRRNERGKNPTPNAINHFLNLIGKVKDELFANVKVH